MFMTPQRKRLAATFTVAAALFMEILDSTVITTALPAIGRDFDTAPANLSISVSSYLVALTIFIPLSGWLAERFGAKRLFALAIFIFALASYLCSLSYSLETLTLARILQGLGGAMMVPVGRYIVMSDTPKNEMVKSIALLTWPALFAPVLGPVVGGWITEQWGWSWVFLINLPIATVLLLACYFTLPTVEKNPDRHFDFQGFILTALGFGTTMAGIELFSDKQILIAWPLACLCIGVILCWISFHYLRRAKQPLFSLNVFDVDTFRISAYSGSIYRSALSSVPFLFPLHAQLTLGYSATQSGALLLWLFAGNLSIKPATTWIMNTFGFRKLLLTNGLLISLSFFAIATISSNTPTWVIIVILFASGMSRSTQFTAYNTLSFSDVDRTQMKDASLLTSVINQMNMGFGIALGSLALLISSAFSNSVGEEIHSTEFSIAYVIIGVFSLLALHNVAKLTSDSGREVLTH